MSIHHHNIDTTNSFVQYNKPTLFTQFFVKSNKAISNMEINKMNISSADDKTQEKITTSPKTSKDEGSDDVKKVIHNRAISSDSDIGDDSDSTYHPESDDDFVDEDFENAELDRAEYHKFLANLFPSKYMSDKARKTQDMKDMIVAADEEHDIESDDSEEVDTDDDEYFDSEEELEKLKNSMKFNIVFTIANPDEDEDEDDEEDDIECDTSDIDSDSDIEEEMEKLSMPKRKSTRLRKKLFAKQEQDEEVEETKVEEKVVTPKTPPRPKRRITPETVSTPKKESKQTKSTPPPAPKKKSRTSKNEVVTPKKDTPKEDALKKHDMDTIQKMLSLLESQEKGGESEVLKKFKEITAEEQSRREKLEKKRLKKEKHELARTFRKEMRNKTNISDNEYFMKLSLDKQRSILDELREVNRIGHHEKPDLIRLLEADMPKSYKAKALTKMNTLKNLDPGAGEYVKVKQWVDTFMKIPFGKYASLPVQISSGIDKCGEFMLNAKTQLDNAVFGMNDAKMQILQLMGQWISNPGSIGGAFALKGPMGTGKTTLVKEGISRILNRPFAFIPLGGATDSAYLEGHSYTYEGSTWGKIVETLIQSKVMNPVFYFDELCKVSDTPKGEEIISILTHLTDTTQNSEFHEKYFSNVDFDLSKALFIFSYNDEHKVNPILRDRMTVIETSGYSSKDKQTIARDYLLPSIRKNLNITDDDITISDEVLQKVVSEYTGEEKGVRNLKRALECVFNKLNMYRLVKPGTQLFDNEDTMEVTYPYNITEDVVKKLLKRKEVPQHIHFMYT